MGIARKLLFFLVALLFTLYVWLGGGIVSQWLAPWAMWLALLIAEVGLLLPEQRQMESLFEARRRVWRSLARDPLTWLSVALGVYLAVQWMNGSTCLQWDVQAQAWRVMSPAFECLRHPLTEQAMRLRPPDPAVASTISVAEWAQQAAAGSGGSAGVWWVPWRWLPGCLRADEARGVLDWFVPVLTALVAVRHGLGRRSKRQLCTYVCVMSGVLVVAGVVQYVVGGTFLYWGRESHAFFFATFGYPNHAACFFPGVMLMALGMMLWGYEHREHTRMPPWGYAAVAGLCGVGAVLSGSRAGMLFTLAIVLFAAVYVPMRFFGSWPAKLRVAVPVVLFLGVGVVLGTAAFRIYAVEANRAAKVALQAAQSDEERAAAAQMPTFGAMPALDEVLMEIADTDWARFLAHPMLMRSGYQGILALRQAAEHPWYGTGAWSFRWLNVRYINPEAEEEKGWYRQRMGTGQANVHNDALQFLAEHGWVGFGLMLGCVAGLMGPFLWAFLRSPGCTGSDEIADRVWVNRLDAFGVFALAGTTMIALHSVIDLVFRSPACMMLYGLFFVCAPGFLVGVPLGARGKAAKAEEGTNHA